MNEVILTQLRRVSGINLNQFEIDFGVDLAEINKESIMSLKNQSYVEIKDDQLKLTSRGFLVADEIALKLFFDE
jgi:oxygen-independent coproporphyrinogen-3 oxidase